MHVLDNRLVAPGAKLADGSVDHVEAAAAAGYLEQVNGPVEHSCCLFDVALADVREGQIHPGRDAGSRPWRPSWVAVRVGGQAGAEIRGELPGAGPGSLYPLPPAGSSQPCE